MMVIDHWLDGVERVQTANVGGPIDARFLIIHYTAGPSVASAVRTLTRGRGAKPVSAHIVIGRAGEIVQLSPFNLVTWHAGRSRWQSGGHDNHDLNRLAIGIELVNAGPLTESSEGNLHA